MVSELSNRNSFKVCSVGRSPIIFWHDFPIWQHKMLHISSCDFSGQDTGHTHTPHINKHWKLLVYNQKKDRGLIILGIETWCTWIGCFTYIEAGMPLLSPCKKRKSQPFIWMFRVSLCQKSDFWRHILRLVPNRKCGLLHSSLVLCQGRHIWVSESKSEIAFYMFFLFWQKSHLPPLFFKSCPCSAKLLPLCDSQNSFNTQLSCAASCFT